MEPFLFPIRREETLRYLGYQGQPLEDSLLEKLNLARERIRRVSRPLYTYRIFPLSRTETGLVPQGTSLLLSGEDIANHLAGCNQVALMAATLGVQVDKEIKYLELTDMTLGAMADAAATAAVEELCDWVEITVHREAKCHGLFATGRFSPGYGDLPIRLQREFTRALDTPKTIGLTVNGSGILLPRKSVTAILGLSSEPIAAAGRSCTSCPNWESCPYRKGGTFCEPDKTTV